MPAVVSRNPVLVETIVLLYKWAIPPLVNLMTDELKSCQMLPASGIAMVHAVNRMFGCVLQTHWASAAEEEEGREGGEGGEGNRGRSSSSQSMRSVEEDGGATTTDATEAALTDEQRITLIDSMFLFSCVWSIGASLTQEGRVSFNDSFRTLCSGNDERYRPPRPFESKGSMIPGGTGDKSVFDYFLAVEVLGNSGGQRVQWTTWTDLIKEEITAPLPLDLRFDQIVVPTCEGRCLKELLDVLVTYAQHPLVIGGSGTGKTVYLQNFLNDRMLVKTKTSDTSTMGGGTMGGSMGSGEKAEYCLKTMQFSTFTTPPDIQTNVLEGMLKRKGSRTITSKSSQKTLFIIDDINMPEKEEYGAQPPLELIRQGTATAATAATESTVCMYCCELLLLLL